MISVIVPIYNGEKTISKTIESILNNPFKDFELLLVDDGSIDNTLSICNEYAENDERIIVLHQDNKGVSSARNYGMDNAKGEYYAFIDADDIIEKGYFEELYQYIDKNALDWVECAFQIEEKDHTITHSYFKNDLIARDKELESIVLPHLFYSKYASIWLHTSAPYGSLYRASKIKELRFNEEIEFGEDILFNYEWVHYISSYGFINKPLYHVLKYQSVATKKYRQHFIDEICKLLSEINNIREVHKDPLINEELTFVVKNILSILVLHIFPTSTKETRKKKYQILNDKLEEKTMRYLVDNISPEKCDNSIFKVLIVLLKKRQYELLYLIWRLKHFAK